MTLQMDKPCDAAIWLSCIFASNRTAPNNFKTEGVSLLSTDNPGQVVKLIQGIDKAVLSWLDRASAFSFLNVHASCILLR